MGAVSIGWTVLVMGLNPAQNVLGDSITAIGFGIAFYYGFTGIACAVYFRREIFTSVRKFVLVGLVPFTGGLIMAGVFAKAAYDNSKAGVAYSKPILGIEAPIAIGIGGLLLGVVVMLATIPVYRDFFRRRPEVAEPGILDREVEHASAHL
jgi:hypothetical protein